MKRLRSKDMDEQADQTIHDLLKEVITQSYVHSRADDKVSKALLAFLVRVSNTWRSIRTLRNHTEDSEGFMADAGTLLRAMYDAYLQAAYLVSDQGEALKRASDYFDFEHVERYRSMTQLLKADNWIAKRLKSSSKRSDGEEENERRYNEVKDRFRGNRQGRSPIRNQWYPGNLRNIAEAAGKSDEYDTFLVRFNGCVHSSEFALTKGPPISSVHVLTMASTIAASVARLNIEHGELTLSPVHQRLLEVLCESANE